MTDEQKIAIAEALQGKRHFNTLSDEIKMRAKVLGILYDEYKNMQNMRDEIVRYNSDKPNDQKWGSNIDEHFHQRAFYRAGQLGSKAADFALWAGRRKEDWDWVTKQLFSDLSSEEISADRRKDLKNNKTKAIMGVLHPDIPVDIAVPVPKNSTTEKFWYTMEAHK